LGRPYSEDLRSRIVVAVEGGGSRNAAAPQFAVSVSCVVAPAAHGNKPYALEGHEALVREVVAARPDLTLDELHHEIGGRGIHVGRSSVNRQACGLTLKKSRFMPPSSNGRTSRPRARIGVLPNRI